MTTPPNLARRNQYSFGAAQVFAYVADQTNAPRWQSGLHEVHRHPAVHWPAYVRRDLDHASEGHGIANRSNALRAIAKIGPKVFIPRNVPFNGWRRSAVKT